ncbi:MAG: DUF1194 domain-containing protein [Pseudomonadota bacterium]
MKRTLISLVLAALPLRLRACDLALILAVDVSGSVDPAEYHLQMKGLADAVRDPVISEALVTAQASVLLLQWTGSGRQQVTVPWRQMTDADAVMELATTLEHAPRSWRNFSTAIGEALEVALAQFADAPDCLRRVVDVSGDGYSNEGIAPDMLRPALRAAGVTVNALAIEASDPMLTMYFRNNVITGPGAFVVTALDYRDYPDKIRLKLLRETAAQLSEHGIDAWDDKTE